MITADGTTETITLDTCKRDLPGDKPRISPLRRGERNNVTLCATVRRNRRTYNLAGMSAHLVWQASDGKLVGPIPMEIVDAALGTARCTLPDACYSTVGTARAYIEIRRNNTLVDTTEEMLVAVLDCIDPNAEQAKEYTPLLDELRSAVTAAKRATDAANDAATHQPRIGGAGFWETWDAAAGAYVDTGILAKGAPGAPGRDATATDVRINGKSITADGVANIPLADRAAPGVVGVDSRYGVALGTTSNIYVNGASINEISKRSTPYKPITTDALDYAVKAAMCDGVGPEWTNAEQAAARKRMGIDAAIDAAIKAAKGFSE